MPHARAPRDQRSLRVLVVDDYAPMADLLAQTIRVENHAAMAVYGSEEALRVAEKFSPDALIADVMMPGMGGPELARAFAEKYPGCRVILLTASHWVPRNLSIGQARVKVLQKPFDRGEILEFLATCGPKKIDR